MATITMDTTQKVLGHIDGYFAENGDAATVDGPTRWESSDTSVFTVVVSPDGMDAEIISTDAPMDSPARTATLTRRSDANKDPNVNDDIVETDDVIVTSMAGPIAARSSATFGAPVPK